MTIRSEITAGLVRALLARARVVEVERALEHEIWMRRCTRVAQEASAAPVAHQYQRGIRNSYRFVFHAANVGQRPRVRYDADQDAVRRAPCHRSHRITAATSNTAAAIHFSWW